MISADSRPKRTSKNVEMMPYAFDVTQHGTQRDLHPDHGVAARNLSAAQLAIAEELRHAGFELDDDNEELIASLPTIFAVLEDPTTLPRYAIRSGMKCFSATHEKHFCLR
jgi:hypothetical protein